MNLPKSVRIAGLDIKIEVWHPKTAIANNDYGEFSSQELVIRIDIEHNKFVVLDTFLHELLHAVYYAYNISEDDKEERTVTTIAHGLTQVLRDNKDVREFIYDL